MADAQGPAIFKSEPMLQWCAGWSESVLNLK